VCEKNEGGGIAATDTGTHPVLRGNRCNNNGGWGINHFEDATSAIASDNVGSRNKAGDIKP
jgi:hypothetical protein